MFLCLFVTHLPAIRFKLQSPVGTAADSFTPRTEYSQRILTLTLALVAIGIKTSHRQNKNMREYSIPSLLHSFALEW